MFPRLVIFLFIAIVTFDLYLAFSVTSPILNESLIQSLRDIYANRREIEVEARHDRDHCAVSLQKTKSEL